MNYEVICRTAPATPGLLITRWLGGVDLFLDLATLLSEEPWQGEEQQEELHGDLL